MRVFVGTVNAGRCEKKARMTFPTVFAQAERPVLVVPGEGGITRPAFADNIKVFSLSDVVKFHPSLDRNRVAIGKIKRAARAAIGQSVTGSVAIELHRDIFRVEIGERGRTRTGEIAMHATMFD